MKAVIDRPRRPLVHHAGLMLSGEKLVDHPALRQLLLDNEPEAIGGEMEGSGIYVSANTGKVDWILVKAMCDWGDGKKKSSWQRTAAKHATTVVKKMLRQSACWEARRI
jgi:nucleoside phosphorylase